MTFKLQNSPNIKKTLTILYLSLGYVFCTSLLGQNTYFDNIFYEYDSIGLPTVEFIGDVKYSESSNAYFAVGEYRYWVNESTRLTNPVLYQIDETGSLILRSVSVQDTTLAISFHIKETDNSLISGGRVKETQVLSSNYYLQHWDVNTFESQSFVYGEYADTGTNNNNEGLFAIVPAYDEGLMLMGMRFTGTSSQTAQVWYNKVVNDTIAWEFVIDGPSLDVPADMVANPIDSSYVILYSQDVWNGISWEQNTLLVKIDQQGNTLQQSLPLFVDDFVNNTSNRDLFIDSNNNFLISGWSYSNGGFVTKVNQDFEKLWHIEHNPNPGYITEIHKGIEANDGNYIFVGDNFLPDSLNIISYWESEDGPVQVNTWVVGYLLKVNAATGDTIWTSAYYHLADTMSTQHYPQSITNAPDGGYVVGGYTTGHPHSSKAWIIYLDENGCMDTTNCYLQEEPDDTMVSAIQIEYEDPFEIKVQVKPNPSNGIYNIQVNYPYETGYSLFNSQGNLIKASGLMLTNQTINISNQPNGVYLLRLRNNKGRQKVVKLLKQ